MVTICGLLFSALLRQRGPPCARSQDLLRVERRLRLDPRAVDEQREAEVLPDDEQQLDDVARREQLRQLARRLLARAPLLDRLGDEAQHERLVLVELGPAVTAGGERLDLL